MDATSPSVSFIGIVDFTEDARWLYASESAHDLLGFEPRELIGTPSLDLVHPDEFPQVRAIHYLTITQDKAAVLVYLRLRHKDPCRGYVLCAISRTVCQNVLVGSVSFASPGPKAMHNASTAQEVTIITPTAKDFEFRRWGDPNPMPPCPIPPALIPPDAPPSLLSTPMRFAPLPEQSVRTALILDRFSLHCRVLYCSNDSILSTVNVMSRSFFDFVAKRDEELVRSWVEVIKGWGVNERGQPSDGGFGFGKFGVCVEGRDSSDTHAPKPTPASRRQGQSQTQRDRRGSQSLAPAHKTHGGKDSSGGKSKAGASTGQELVVDAIFSAHSDGLMVILRPSTVGAAQAQAQTQERQAQGQRVQAQGQRVQAQGQIAHTSSGSSASSAGAAYAGAGSPQAYSPPSSRTSRSPVSPAGLPPLLPRGAPPQQQQPQRAGAYSPPDSVGHSGGGQPQRVDARTRAPAQQHPHPHAHARSPPLAPPPATSPPPSWGPGSAHTSPGMGPGAGAAPRTLPPLHLTRESLTLPPILAREPGARGARPASSHTR